MRRHGCMTLHDIVYDHVIILLIGYHADAFSPPRQPDRAITQQNLTLFIVSDSLERVYLWYSFINISIDVAPKRSTKSCPQTLPRPHNTCQASVSHNFFV